MAVLFVILYYFVSSMIDVMALDSFIAVYSAEVWRGRGQIGKVVFCASCRRLRRIYSYLIAVIDIVSV